MNLISHLNSSAAIFDSIASTTIPSRHFGNLRITGFELNGVQALAIISGNLNDQRMPPLVRVHSQCLFGEVLGSLKCDCLEQLHTAIRLIQDEPPGVVVYLYQEGRGAGIMNKIKGYALSDVGYDTVEAYEALNLPVDQRDYSIAASVLKKLDIVSIRMLTNNPDKIGQLEKYGIKVQERVPIEIDPNPHDYDYLATKKTKMNHFLSLRQW